MKLFRHLLCAVALAASVHSAYAQAPGLINYQAVARDAAGNIMVSGAIAVRFTIYDGSAGGAIQYEETQNITTNQYGLFNVEIGSGSVVSGSMAGVTWGNGLKYLGVEINPPGGSGYVSMGTQQLVSVPYSLSAGNAITAGGLTSPLSLSGDVTGTSAAANVVKLQGQNVSATAPATGQALEWNGTAWTPSPVGTVTSVTAGSGLSGGTITTSGTISMPGVGTAGTYGSATQVPVLTTDPQGRVTGVTNTTIAGDNWGTDFVHSDATLTGNGTASTPLKIAQQGATAGQVLNWTGTTWLPVNTVSSVTAGAGLSGGTILTTGTISLPNTGTPATYGSATQVPVFTTDPQGRVTAVTNTTIAGDNWGSAVAHTDATLAGNGTTGSPLTIAQQSAVVGQVMKWNGTSWAPATVTGTGTVTSIATTLPITGGPITSGGTIGLATTGTAGTYGSASLVPSITTDAYGRVTGVTTSAVSATMGGDVTGLSSACTVAKLRGVNVSGTAPAANQFLQYNGGTAAWTPTSVTVPVFSGTANYIPRFTSATNIGNSLLYQTGNNIGLGTTTPVASLDLESTTDTVMQFISQNGTPTVYGTLRTQYNGSTDVARTGIYSTTIRGGFTDAQGTAIIGAGSSEGVAGLAESSTAAQVTGVEGDGFGSGSFSVGVAGFADEFGSGSPTNAYGVYGNAQNGVTNYAAYFDGDVYVNGSVSKSGGTFKIDHPLDPSNKYLYHSFVESPDMMNIYNGNAVTDASGTAVVALPDYFETLNKDFRYQLTVIGSFAQAMVSREVSGNTFEIKTNAPGVKVSWMITGVRQDAWANAHRVVPEVEKEAGNKGKYLDAKDLGKPANQQIGHEIIEQHEKSRAAKEKAAVPAGKKSTN